MRFKIVEVKSDQWELYVEVQKLVVKRNWLGIETSTKIINEWKQTNIHCNPCYNDTMIHYYETPGRWETKQLVLDAITESMRKKDEQIIDIE